MLSNIFRATQNMGFQNRYGSLYGPHDQNRTYPAPPTPTLFCVTASFDLFAPYKAPQISPNQLTTMVPVYHSQGLSYLKRMIR